MGGKKPANEDNDFLEDRGVEDASNRSEHERDERPSWSERTAPKPAGPKTR